MRAIDSVRGISLGQTAAQFWALPQSETPPSSIRGLRRSPSMSLPTGWELKRRTWEMAAGPMNLEWELIWGQASVQQPQVMQVERTYIASCTLGLILGPKP